MIAAASRPGSGPLLWSGVVAGLLYTAIVVVGGVITPGYSHVTQPVSSLYESGSANGAAIALAFVVYNVFAVAFGIGVARFAKTIGGPRARAGIGAGVTLVLTGIAGAIDDVFPQDPIGDPITTVGGLHIAFAGIASLTTIVATVLAVAWLLARPNARGFSIYSIVSFAVILCSGPITAAQTAANSPQMGLFERITIFTFVIWMLALSAYLAMRRGNPQFAS